MFLIRLNGPWTDDMTAEEPSVQSLTPVTSVTEVKLMSEEELNNRNQEPANQHQDKPPEDESTSSESDEPICRICHEGGSSGDLLSPCECSGTLAMVHQSCLEHWLCTSNSSHCELCHHHFTLERLPKTLSEWLCSPSIQQQRRTLYGDAVCFLFITPLACVSGWLCVQGAMDLYYTNGLEALGLLVLTLALFIIYVFWTVVSLRYHQHLFNTWKTTDQKVHLQMPLPAHGMSNQHTVSINAVGKEANKETVV